MESKESGSPMIWEDSQKAALTSTLVRCSVDIPVGPIPPRQNLSAYLRLSLPTSRPSTEARVGRDAEIPQVSHKAVLQAGPCGMLLGAAQHGIATLPIPTHSHTQIMSTYITLVPGNLIPVISHSVRCCTDTEQAVGFSS